MYKYDFMRNYILKLHSTKNEQRMKLYHEGISMETPGQKVIKCF